MTHRFLDVFLTIFGRIKVFRWPAFIVYDPGSYRVKGHDERDVMAVARPGDVLVRGYDNYLDGYFIPGYFSHAALYLGEVREEDRAHVPAEGQRVFEPGPQRVVHAMAGGVFMEDLLQFCRCDRLAILRFPQRLARNDGLPEDQLPKNLYSEDEWRVRRRLAAGEEIAFEEAFPTIKRTALSQLGREYDFEMDFTNFRRLSCTELVYFATKCLEPFHGVVPTERRLLWLRRNVIVPDAFARSPLELAWLSPSADEARVAAMRPQATPATLTAA